MKKQREPNGLKLAILVTVKDLKVTDWKAEKTEVYIPCSERTDYTWEFSNAWEMADDELRKNARSLKDRSFTFEIAKTATFKDISKSPWITDRLKNAKNIVNCVQFLLNMASELPQEILNKMTEWNLGEGTIGFGNYIYYRRNSSLPIPNLI